MDRNYICANNHVRIREVALRKESVDRNTIITQASTKVIVALRKESVDRNKIKDNRKPPPRQSLSARRAWIEIAITLDSGALPGGRSPQGERG